MLTKDLIRCKIRSGKVIPQFVDPQDSSTIRLAEDLLIEFSKMPGRSRKDIETHLVDNFDSSQGDFQGLRKLLFDKCRWQDDDAAIADTRWQWLREAQQLRSRLSLDQMAEYRNAIAAHLEKSFEDIGLQLFSDLPENKVLIEVEELSATALLQRYNTALVQGILLKSSSMRLKSRKVSTIQKRNLFRNLKFHQLMAVKASSQDEKPAVNERNKDDNSSLDIIIDGPLNLFQKTSAYGVKFANFFPHVLNLETWEIVAEVEWKKKRLELKLTDKNGLVGHYPDKGGYIPVEFEHFLSSFNGLGGEWTAKFGAEFVNVGKQSFCFPDIEFQKTGNKSVALELFHKWHRGQLLSRLDDLERSQINGVIIGVCRKVAKQKDVALALDKSMFFQAHGMLFSDFPTPKNAMKILAKV